MSSAVPPQSTDGQTPDVVATPPAVVPNFMKSITPEFLTALTCTQKGFITSIRILESNDSLTGIALKRAVADMVPPASLFSKEICDLSAVHTELRDFLDSRGANLQQHSSHRITMTLAHSLYEEPEDTQAAVETARATVAVGHRTRSDFSRQSGQAPPPVTASASTIPHGTTTDRLAHNVAMRLKHNENKFSGDLGECWMEFVDEYLQISRDYSLTPIQKLQYMHNLLRGDAKRYFLDRVDGYATGFQQAVSMIEEEYNSQVRQTRVKNYLSSIRSSTFVGQVTETSEALAKVYKIISKTGSSLAPGDAHKIEFLRNAIVGLNWASEPLSRVSTHNLTFQQLFGELEAALQLNKEATIANLRDMAELQGQHKTDEVIPGIFYNGSVVSCRQGRYVNIPSNLSNRKPTRTVRFKTSSMGASNPIKK